MKNKQLIMIMMALSIVAMSASARGEAETAGAQKTVIAVPRSQGSMPHTFMALVTEDGEKLRVHEDDQKEIRALEPYLYEFVIQFVSGGGPFDSVRVISFKRVDK